MLKIDVMLDKWAYMPTKAHSADAGFDLYIPEDYEAWDGMVNRTQPMTVDTGVHMLIPEGYVGMIKSKSGLNVKHGIRCEGVVDAEYTGSIVVKVYSDAFVPYRFCQGEKLAQIVILPIPEVELQQVEVFPFTDRGDNGFGSSGK